MTTDWLKKWKEGDIGFHLSAHHPQLEKFGHLLSTGPVLVPLCGKSLDMVFLASKGHEVIGVELSPIACKSFFEENRIPYTVRKEQDFEVYVSEKITIWCGDFFKLPPSVWDRVTGMYDRAALIALPADVRKKYVEEVLKKNPRPFEVLLITVEYPDGTIPGPPFSVSEMEVKNLFTPWQTRTLATGIKTARFDESVYRITSSKE